MMGVDGKEDEDSRGRSFDEEDACSFPSGRLAMEDLRLVVDMLSVANSNTLTS